MIHNLTETIARAARLGCGIAIIRDHNTGTTYDTRHNTAHFPYREDAWGPR
jgi:hypothetical protein